MTSRAAIVHLLLAWMLAAPAQAQDLFARSYALVVGVDDYSTLGMARLSNAESDATAVARYFGAQRYEVTQLIGAQAATKARVADAVRAIAARIGEGDRFVFFFAGHGKARRTEGVDIAYLVVPGGRDRNDPASLISTGDIADWSRQLNKARHQLFIFDSCYAGLMGQFQTRAAGDERTAQFDSEIFLARDLASRRVRQYLAAGGEDQEVLDNGPARLSWFTYFLLKGVEPGVASRRASGLITFSELASYVQALSANPKHTPAFGSLAGHRGGEFLLLSTAQGNPKLPALPNISRQTLRDLGFLTRSDAPEAVGETMAKMREPIDRIFEAWTKKDLALYRSQFDPAVVQTGRLKGGATYRRGYEQIVERRRADFARLERVEVLKYEVMYQGSEAGEASFGARYSMDFHWRDGTVTREHNINECYRVRQQPGAGRWTVVRNDDYQSRICYQ
ncbi:MAG TPA: caspase family protein [Burkholderiaceae bacterium]|nr:caspase family protein [Burkholderiaceae bacterium]